MLNFKFVLPAPGANDVTERRLDFNIAGGEPIAESLEGSALESSEHSGEQDAEVVGSLVDIDDAGNASEPRDFTFLLVDTIAPPIPGEVGISILSES